MSRRAFARFVDAVEQEGRILVTVKYVAVGDRLYLVDGHHRTRAALELGFARIPARRVELPFLGYRTLEDLFDREF